MFRTFLTLWLVANFIMVECQNDKDCCARLKKDRNKTQRKYGVFRFQLGGEKLKMECDDSNDGGWTMIQRRYYVVNGVQQDQEDFNRTFTEYENGFGEVSSEKSYWLGLKRIAELTKNRDQSVRFYMENFGPVTYYKYGLAHYNYFYVDPKANYKLEIRDYNISNTEPSTAGDSLTNATTLPRFNVNGMEFRTWDRGDVRKCATNYEGGWWWNCCGEANPNGVHHKTRTFDHGSVTWPTFDGYFSLQRMRIMVRNRDRSDCGI